MCYNFLAHVLVSTKREDPEFGQHRVALCLLYSPTQRSHYSKHTRRAYTYSSVRNHVGLQRVQPAADILCKLFPPPTLRLDVCESLRRAWLRKIGGGD